LKVRIFTFDQLKIYKILFSFVFFRFAKSPT
jgi:hypothetical protein